MPRFVSNAPNLSWGFEAMHVVLIFGSFDFFQAFSEFFFYFSFRERRRHHGSTLNVAQAQNKSKFGFNCEGTTKQTLKPPRRFRLKLE